LKYSLTEQCAYQALVGHYIEISRLHMRDMFAEDRGRFKKFSIQVGELLLDYSKNQINEETMGLLFELARTLDVELWRERMFTGEKINNTEGRAVLHIALRNRSNRPICIDGQDVMPEVNRGLTKVAAFAERVRRGEWLGYTGRVITDVVNIGIGGSDVGPQMVCQALKPYHHPHLKLHFVSNVDAAHIEETLVSLDPETTLFIISSKTFTTQETLTNARSARTWFLDQAQSEDLISRHFVAVSSHREAVSDFGIELENMFELWDWVGGRYSLWSSIGLSIVLAVGMDRFIELLEGAYAMDEHFCHAPLERNMPVIMALLGVWYNNFAGAESHAILPYDHYLRSLPIYIAQADMESNGKSVDRDGQQVNYSTGPIIWGATGIIGQHTFFQLIHQGTKPIPADFIATVEAHTQQQLHHDIMISNVIAQTEALMRGRNLLETCESIRATGGRVKDTQERLKQMVFDGNHPTNTLLLKRLTPHNLGALIALYEHKIFVQGIIWNLNSYDQWGVELGKQLAKQVYEELLATESTDCHDASTNGLIRYYHANSRRRRENSGKGMNAIAEEDKKPIIGWPG